jgi:hypothetical protein
MEEDTINLQKPDALPHTASRLKIDRIQIL